MEAKNMTVHLQGIGLCEAIQVKELKVGMSIIWNYGYKSEVHSIRPSKTGKTFKVDLKSLTDGIVRSKNLGANKLVVAG